MVRQLLQQLQGVLSTKDSVETAKVCRAIIEEGVRTICQRLGKEANATSDFLDILDVKLTGGTLPPKKAKDSEDATRRLYIDLYLGEAKWNVLEEKNVSLPKEGFTIAFDEIVIAKDAPRKDFINYLYMAEVAKVNMEFLCGPNPVKPGLELLDEEYRKQILLDAETLKHGQVLKGFDDPKVMELYNKAWDRIKATEAK